MPQTSSELEAMVTLLPTDQGGRKFVLPDGFFRTVLGVGGENFSAELRLAQSIEPGESGAVEIKFLVPDAALPLFPAGATFTIWEGRTIGHGHVIRTLAAR